MPSFLERKTIETKGSCDIETYYIIQMMSLLNNVTKSFIWVLFNNISLFSISLVLNIVLARLLEPQDFGFVALGEFFLLLLNRIKELGFDYAMIHRQDRLEEIASINFTLQLILGTLIMFLGAVFSIVITKIYGLPVGLSLFFLTITAPVKAVVSSYNSLLDKGFAFRKNAIFTVLTNLLFAVFTAFLAWRGFSYLSLTLGLVPGLLFNALIFWRVSPIKLKLFWDKDLVKWFLGFGPWWFWFIAAVASLIISNLDNLLIGTFLGAATLGFYSRAYNFASLVTDRIDNAFVRVLFPVYARLQNDRESLANILSLQIGLIPRLILPLIILGLVNINELVMILLGEKWLGMIPMIYAFFIFMLFRPFLDTLGHFFIAIGKPKVCNSVLIIQAIFMFVLEPFIIFKFHEIGLAVFAGVGAMGGFFLLFSKVKGLVGNLNLTGIILFPIIANGLSLLLVLLALNYFSHASSVVLLFCKSVIFSISYVALLFLFEKSKVINDLRRLVVLEQNDAAF